MPEDEKAILQTKKWITDVVIGCNFCPFAAKELRKDAVHYQIETSSDTEIVLQSFSKQCQLLDHNKPISTSLLILTQSFSDFDDYLNLISLAEKWIGDHEYEGIYQVASFHPLYLFAGTQEDDAANYTNRSPYPMLHLLREDMIEAALEKFTDPDKIPENNIQYARQKGLAHMERLRNACMVI